jgi:RNA polymerase sigma-70 factor (ECF subfamily)
MRAWRAIGRFDGRAQLFTWLYRIGVNEVKRRASRKGRRPPTVPLASLPSDPPDLADEPQRRAEHRYELAALEQAIVMLPLEYRAPLVLRDIEGLSTAEAASLLGLGEAAFKSRLHRARLAVRGALTEALDGGGGLDAKLSSRGREPFCEKPGS